VLAAYRFTQQNPPGAEVGIAENKVEVRFPETLSLFTAGTVAKNIGIFAELESNIIDRETGVERAFVTFDNVIGRDIAHIRVGQYDPSATSSFATLRQQLVPIRDSLHPSSNVVQRAGLVPLAAAGKFYGLRDRSGSIRSPYTPALYNGTKETGIEIRGRPLGPWLLYQIGMLNGSGESFGDSNKGKDLYGAFRLDYAESDFFSASLTGFAYIGNSNATVSDGTSNADVNWHRYGVAAHARYKMVDVYGLYTFDRLTHVPAGSGFDPTASGMSIAADAYVTNQTLLSVRYDHMDAGGDLTQRTSQSFLGIQIKQYLRANIAIYTRGDVNVRTADNGLAAAQNLRNAFFAGIDMTY